MFNNREEKVRRTVVTKEFVRVTKASPPEKGA